MTGFTGRCLCGAVRFGFAGAPVATRACWCRDCQYLSSGNASVNAIFKAEGFSLEGEVSEYESLADSGNTMRRRFCPRCGTPLFSQSSARPHLMVVRAGALDDREAARPTAVIWTDSAPGWGLLDPDLPSSPRQPEGLPKD